MARVERIGRRIPGDAPVTAVVRVREKSRADRREDEDADREDARRERARRPQAPAAQPPAGPGARHVDIRV